MDRRWSGESREREAAADSSRRKEGEEDEEQQQEDDDRETRDQAAASRAIWLSIDWCSVSSERRGSH